MSINSRLVSINISIWSSSKFVWPSNPALLAKNLFIAFAWHQVCPFIFSTGKDPSGKLYLASFHSSHWCRFTKCRTSLVLQKIFWVMGPYWNCQYLPQKFYISEKRRHCTIVSTKSIVANFKINLANPPRPKHGKYINSIWSIKIFFINSGSDLFYW